MKNKKNMSAPLLCSVFLFSAAVFLWMFGIYVIGSVSQSYMIEWQILSMCGVEWSLPIIIDYISLIFSCFVCLISGSVSLFSVSYMDGEIFMRRFMLLIMAFVGSMNLLIFIPSLITILLGWDGLGIVSFALVIYYQNKKSLAAGMLTVLANRIGDALLILSICLLVNWGEWCIGYGMIGSFSLLICFLVVVGAMTKSAQIPFSAWLPAAMAAPTPVSALVHSSTLVTAGVYLVIRFYSTLVEMGEVMGFLSKVGALTLLMAGLSACFEVDLKKIIALSTLSQLGLMMFTVGVGFPIIAVFHLFTHALFKALLFLCAGSIIHSTMDTQDGRILGGLNYLLPFSSSCLVLSSVALCGMPFLSGFYSKDLILEGVFSSFNGSLEVFVMLVGAGLSLVYSLRILLIGVFGQNFSSSLFTCSTESGYIVSSIIILSVGAIVGGWFLQSVWVSVNGFSLVGVFGKVVISIITFMGLLYGFINFFLVEVLKWKTFGSLSRFLSSMWFMNLVSGSFLAGVGLKLGGLMHLHLDLGWMEVLGGQGVFKVLGGGVGISYYMQSGGLLVYTRIFLIMLVFLLVGFWYF
uniref:NADH-ubiquinone oxidoreductase chain 5 n=1 Tax=Unio pictorum TaxID=55837 RepID=E5EW22_UNIPI|nr:NADH dehydrogenase subunit 5 [Unio pictorum]ADE18135.1 NADH dehydrogenase subunit 5 [Unio pictorum]ADE18148.1 NADH dehydrogenase subunit 5 [Unio pictorum]ADE18161.1 NADH dehydrogenase subunit 5 [Unio pictorum]ADE18174.1 NADH dehydrogenase subunit 5 [Unio pictorum]ADE18187.1 NADH dehydrogenase subunit 5 [Unio pictorum]